jgi:hypothetical protein
MKIWFGNVDWKKEFEDLDLNGKWQKFCAIIESAVQKFVPLGYANSKKYPKWMNKVTRAARKHKFNMWTKYRQSRSSNDLTEYKKAQNRAVREYRKAKRQFEKKLAKDIQHNPKSFMHMFGLRPG